MGLMDMMKKPTANTSNERAAQRPAASKTPLMPYAGLLIADQDPLDDGLNAGRRAGDLALSGWHMLLCGLTGSGKGRRVITPPGIIMFGQNPVIAMSTKGDLADDTIRKRAQRGPVYTLDLSNEIRESELHGVDVTAVRSDPCALVSTETRPWR